MTDTTMLTLSDDEVLVLFEFLARGACAELPFADQAEQRVLWNIEAMLERQLGTILSPDYAALLNRARERVRDKPA